MSGGARPTDEAPKLDSTLDPRIQTILDLIVDIAGGRLHARGAPSPAHDEIDAIVVGLNMLAEDLAARERERDEAQAALERLAAELGRSNEELEHFGYLAAHDLQEPVRMVSSFLELLRHRYAGAIDEKADRYIQHAVDGAKRMQQLIRDLLLYSQVGQGEPERRPVQLGDVVADALDAHAHQLKTTGAVVRVDPLPTIPGDADELGQVFEHLIGNALKFRRATPRIHIYAVPRGEAWEVSVRDNGIGFDLAYADRVFVIFKRLHAREAYPGTGVGLAIAKKIVARHHGRIWVHSEPDSGSVFTFTLPGLAADG